MRSLRHSIILVPAGGVFDKQLHQLLTASSSSKMRFSKAPGLLKEAVTAFKIKAEVLRTRLLLLASLRRRMALVGAMQRRIHALVSSSSDGGREKPQQARVKYYGDDRALVLHKAMAASQEPVAMFDEDDDDHAAYPDWTHSLFEDDNCYNDAKDDDALDALDEPSVIDIIRSSREVQGLEFNMDQEIDEACDMFIRRFRKQMNHRSF